MPRVVKREAAKRDLIRHFVYLGQSNLQTAERFLKAAERTFADLARMPLLGSPGKIPHRRYASVRLWRIQGFEKYLIAYRPLKDGVQIERVIHAAQDYLRILGAG